MFTHKLESARIL